MRINKAIFKITVANGDGILKDNVQEVAFVGRSNVGKSSLINSLTNRKKLAKTSSTPGKTKHLNYFLINDSFYIVDLPGYGYHKASKVDEKKWKTLIDEYLMKANTLKCIFVLIDIRRSPSQLDRRMIEYLHQYNITFNIIATKADKLSKSERKNAASKIAIDLALGTDNIIITSSTDKSGIDKLLKKIGQYVNG